MKILRHGHAPGHVRDSFLSAVEAFMGWNDGEPEPSVEYEVGYVTRQVSISQMCGLLWNCTDIIPRWEYSELRDGAGLDIGRQTYAACARAMRASIDNALSI